MKLLVSLLITMAVVGELGYQVDNLTTEEHFGFGLLTFLFTLGSLKILSGNNFTKNHS